MWREKGGRGWWFLHSPTCPLASMRRRRRSAPLGRGASLLRGRRRAPRAALGRARGLGGLRLGGRQAAGGLRVGRARGRLGRRRVRRAARARGRAARVRKRSLRDLQPAPARPCISSRPASLLARRQHHPAPRQHHPAPLLRFKRSPRTSLVVCFYHMLAEKGHLLGETLE